MSEHEPVEPTGPRPALTQQFGPLKEPTIIAWIGHSGIVHPVYGTNPYRSQA